MSTLAGRDTARGGSPRPDTAARLKVTTRLNEAEVLTITSPKGKPRVTSPIRLPDRTVTAEIASKSLRKTQTAIRDVGADNIALVLQGRLIADDVIAEADFTPKMQPNRHDLAPSKDDDGAPSVRSSYCAQRASSYSLLTRPIFT
jgi:hypothetical protein